jgi:hypothetical protein
MRAQQKISFTIVLKNGEQATYLADNLEHFILMVAALKKHHGNIIVIKQSIKKSKVLVINENGRTTILAKAG